MATSAVALLTATGVLETCISGSGQSREELGKPMAGQDVLRDVHAAISMLSYPAPLWHMYFNDFGSDSTSSASKGPVNCSSS
jgi:hypothetical protein